MALLREMTWEEGDKVKLLLFPHVQNTGNSPCLQVMVLLPISWFRTPGMSQDPLCASRIWFRWELGDRKHLGAYVSGIQALSSLMSQGALN